MNTSDEEIIAQAERAGEIMMSLPPDMPDITRIVIGTDLEHAERMLRAFDRGEIDAERCVLLTGSYARCNTALTLRERGVLSDDWFLSHWPLLWRGSDPDDTDPRFWDVWQEAFAANGGIILDNPDRPLPKGKVRGLVRVYRGQRFGDPKGCAWTTDRNVAVEFARGVGQRAPLRNGRVFQVSVPRGLVLAYLTGRNEAEVIIDPRDMGWVSQPEGSTS